MTVVTVIVESGILVKNNMDIEESIKRAKFPKPLYCPRCNEDMFSPMDKLSLGLYGKCSVHLEEDSHEEKNLLTLSKAL